MGMSKHTGGKWVKREINDFGSKGFSIDFNEQNEQVVDFVYEEGDADVICEAGNVFTDTGLTPAQILEQRNELLEALELADAMLSGANMNAKVVERKVKAAIAKAKGEQA